MVIPVNNREITGFLTFHNRENRRVQIDSSRRFYILYAFPCVWSVFLFLNDKLQASAIKRP